MNGTSRYGQPSPEKRKRRIEARQVIGASPWRAPRS
jgi:hypothetical protein